MSHATAVASKSQESLSSDTEFPAFYGPEDSLPHSQHPAKKFHPTPDQSSPKTPTLFL